MEEILNSSVVKAFNYVRAVICERTLDKDNDSNKELINIILRYSAEAFGKS